MQEKKRKIPLSICEVVLLVVLIPILFYYSGKLLWMIGESETPSWFPYWFASWFTSIWGLLAVLGFDCLWIIAMVFWSLKNLRVKIYITLFILTISGAILVFWLQVRAFSGSMH
jgi:hypothetical protein